MEINKQCAELQLKTIQSLIAWCFVHKLLMLMGGKAPLEIEAAGPVGPLAETAMLAEIIEQCKNGKDVASFSATDLAEMATRHADNVWQATIDSKRN